MAEIVSHGRGGQGNIGPDPTKYEDGEIVRAGDPAASGGAYSSGRGGAGNIGSPSQKPVASGTDDDIVPDNTAVLRKGDEPYHSGRGGQGNARVPNKERQEEEKHDGFADRLKRKIFGVKK